MRRLVFVRRAQRDLTDIRNYIAQDNLHRAESFVIEIIERAGRLVQFPLSCPRTGRRGWRMAIHDPYVILYSVTDQEVRVQRVVHGATRR